MGMKSIVKNTVYTLERVNPSSGFREQISYVGNLRDKPKGWKVVKFIGLQGE